jgi:hypothetical protein
MNSIKRFTKQFGGLFVLIWKLNSYLTFNKQGRDTVVTTQTMSDKYGMVLEVV